MAASKERSAQIVRAAKLRAYISAYMATVSEPQSKPEMVAGLADKMAELGYKADALDNFLYTMCKSGMLSSIKDSHGRTIKYAAGGVIAPSVSKGSVVAKRKKETASASIVVDVIKATGRVRISLAGMTIEIGVEG